MKGKWLTTAIVGALLVGSNAFASIARQAVLGNQPVFTAPGSGVSVNTVNGSLWYDDDYNVFYNPSYINDNKNYVTVNKGLEGGFFKSEFENFAYGVYVNRGGTGGAGAQYGASGLVAPGVQSRGAFIGATGQVLNTQRPIDLFFGGDTGIKWGAHVAWAYNRSQNVATNPNFGDAEVTNRYWHFDLGAQVMGLEPFIGATLFSKYQNNSQATKADENLDEFNVGVRYKYEGWTPYFIFNKHREGGLPVGQAVQVQMRTNVWGFGVGHDTKVADGVHVMKHIGFYMASTEDDAGAVIASVAGAPGTTADQNKDFKDTVIPMNVTVEGEATSWLTLRAGVGFDIINNRKYAASNRTTGTTTSINDKNASLAGNTTFRVGSTLKFGKLNVDSAFGNGSAAAAGTSTATTNLDSTAAGFDSQMFGLLSASYHW